jgi:hypothetical protein
MLSHLVDEAVFVGSAAAESALRRQFDAHREELGRVEAAAVAAARALAALVSQYAVNQTAQQSALQSHVNDAARTGNVTKLAVALVRADRLAGGIGKETVPVAALRGDVLMKESRHPTVRAALSAPPLSFDSMVSRPGRIRKSKRAGALAMRSVLAAAVAVGATDEGSECHEWVEDPVDVGTEKHSSAVDAYAAIRTNSVAFGGAGKGVGLGDEGCDSDVLLAALGMLSLGSTSSIEGQAIATEESGSHTSA